MRVKSAARGGGSHGHISEVTRFKRSAGVAHNVYDFFRVHYIVYCINSSCQFKIGLLPHNAILMIELGRTGRPIQWISSFFVPLHSLTSGWSLRSRLR